MKIDQPTKYEANGTIGWKTNVNKLNPSNHRAHSIPDHEIKRNIKLRRNIGSDFFLIE